MESLPDIILRFNSWFDAAQSIEANSVPGACCLSTNGLDGVPNARFVSLKETTAEGWIITGNMASLKGKEVRANNKVALSFWWDKSQRQVRIQGHAEIVSKDEADRYFKHRKPESRLVSTVFTQGSKISSYQQVEQQYRTAIQTIPDQIDRPDHWSAILIRPIRVEFMEFKPNRLHDRQLHILQNGQWVVQQLQP
ncbi:MAG: pyridoxamine 5'-phosphate oxidase [Saprospiraceae bacterium]|nr:pyridoxamine 5'-phosphate oxidase [Saprospiraceae bacterium]